MAQKQARSNRWHEDWVTEGQKAAYIQAYEEREGIKLENVEKNPGRKGVAKLMLNNHLLSLIGVLWVLDVL